MLTPLPLRIGSVVARRYRATRRIASGAMGEVWEAVHVELGARVAIKVLRKEALECREMVVRFAREAFLLARIHSEHVVRVIDFAPRGRHGPVLVMELLDGPTLADIVQHEKLPIDVAVDVAIDILRGLEALHASQVIHRDVKPANVVLRRMDDGSRRAVLIDLGVGRFLDDTSSSEVTSADRVVGTFEYMAPEQILTCKTANASVDVYAVGAVLYRAVAGAHPFGDRRGVDLLREKLHKPVPRLKTGRRDAAARKFESIVDRALAFDISDRYKSASELLGALETLRRELRAAPLVELSPQIARPRSRTRTAVALAAAGATAFAACSTDIATSQPQSTNLVHVAAPTPLEPDAVTASDGEINACMVERQQRYAVLARE